MSAHRQSSDPRQQEFPFPSLDFPGQQSIAVAEAAKRLGVTVQHIINLAESGELNALNVANARTRAAWRIPIESWHAFILQRMTGSPAENPILALPTHVLWRHVTDCLTRLALRGEDLVSRLKVFLNDLAA